jgi:hypothetical protein
MKNGKNNIQTRVLRLEEHIIVLNSEMKEVVDSCKDIKTALIGDLDRPETIEKSIDRRIGKIELRYQITIGIIVFAVPIIMWVMGKVFK